MDRRRVLAALVALPLLGGCSFLTGTPSSSSSAPISVPLTATDSATAATDTSTSSVTASGATGTDTAGSASVTTAASSDMPSTGPGGVEDPAAALKDDAGALDGTISLNLQGTGRTTSNFKIPTGSTTIVAAMTCAPTVSAMNVAIGKEMGMRGPCSNRANSSSSVASKNLATGLTSVVIDVPAGTQFWLVLVTK